MLIIPAIDIKDGCVVRLCQGKLRDKTVYSRDPLKTAKHWAKQGAELIHVVDLDGAATGLPKNIEIVKDIVKSVPAHIQFGGGVRKLETINALLDSGIYRVVIGTKAVEDKRFLERAFKAFDDKIIVSIDAMGNRALTQGWQESGKSVDALELAAALKDMGFKQLIYTDIAKDGTLKGPNIRSIKAMLRQTRMDIIASGGISSLEDIRKLKSIAKNGVTGIIIGKALYEGKFTLTQALKIS